MSQPSLPIGMKIPMSMACCDNGESWDRGKTVNDEVESMDWRRSYFILTKIRSAGDRKPGVLWAYLPASGFLI